MISRRLFLRSTAAAGAVGAVATPAVAAELRLSPRDQALWHMRELERLAKEAGASSAAIIVAGRGQFNGGNPNEHRLMMIDHSGKIDEKDSMFEGAA